MKTKAVRRAVDNTVASVQTGVRTVLGTHWPVENVVYRNTTFNRVYWTVAFGLCNGISSSSANFSTRKAALVAAGIN